MVDIASFPTAVLGKNAVSDSTPVVDKFSVVVDNISDTVAVLLSKASPALVGEGVSPNLLKGSLNTPA